MSYLNPIAGAVSSYPMAVKEGFNETLDEWIREAPAGLERGEKEALLAAKQHAAGQIQEFLSDPSATTLHFDFEEGALQALGAKLDSFPPIFHPEVLHVFATRLENLNLNDNSIKTVPPDIGQLQSLRILSLDGNELKTLPPEIQKLINLSNLHLKGNKLETLPEEVCLLASLNLLDLRNNELQELPLEIGLLRSLAILSVGRNHLKSLPHTIFHCPLIFLDLSHNELMVAPRIIASLRTNIINLSGNPLNVTPLHPFDLAPLGIGEFQRRTINLENTEIPFALRTMLYEEIGALGYAGPSVLLPEPEARPHGDPAPRPLRESLKDLFFLAEAPPEEFTKLFEDGEWAGKLTTWLTRISDILKEKSRGEEARPYFSTEEKIHNFARSSLPASLKASRPVAIGPFYPFFEWAYFTN